MVISLPGNVWQPFKAENWEASPSPATNWKPPAINEPFDATTSDAGGLDRLSEVTPLRRNTAEKSPSKAHCGRAHPLLKRSPRDSLTSRRRPLSSRYLRVSPESKQSLLQGCVFRRTLLTGNASNNEIRSAAKEAALALDGVRRKKRSDISASFSSFTSSGTKFTECTSDTSLVAYSSTPILYYHRRL